MEKNIIDKVEIDDIDSVISYKESENGEVKTATVLELLHDYHDKPVWLNLKGTDKYGYTLQTWRPAKLSVFIKMDTSYV